MSEFFCTACAGYRPLQNGKCGFCGTPKATRLDCMSLPVYGEQLRWLLDFFGCPRDLAEWPTASLDLPTGDFP